jgi:CheY-like chemotaxis protein
LGLSTALTIIKSHDGFINVYSEAGKGTQFAIYLPAAKSETAATESKPDLPYPTGNGELILIVDDEENIRHITQATLEKFGYRTLTAADGAEALAIYAQNSAEIRLVLTDMAMPFMGRRGDDSRFAAVTPSLPIVAASGLPPAEINELNANRFLPKPYTAEKLLTTLAAILADS